MGALLEDSAGGGAGAVYLLLGPISGELDLAAADAKLTGEQEHACAGGAVAGVGDINRDGKDDFMVGAEGAWRGGHAGGAAYLVLGPVNGELDLGEAATALSAEAENDSAGAAVAGAGDVDGDGAPELLMGAYGADLGGGMAGAAYLFSAADW